VSVPDLEFVPSLSFAKNGSGNVSLRCNAFITMMQAAELWDLDNPSDA
jgi:hypothetical protein